LRQKLGASSAFRLGFAAAARALSVLLLPRAASAAARSASAWGRAFCSSAAAGQPTRRRGLFRFLFCFGGVTAIFLLLLSIVRRVRSGGFRPLGALVPRRRGACLRRRVLRAFASRASAAAYRRQLWPAHFFRFCFTAMTRASRRFATESRAAAVTDFCRASADKDLRGLQLLRRFESEGRHIFLRRVSRDAHSVPGLEEFDGVLRSMRRWRFRSWCSRGIDARGASVRSAPRWFLRRRSIQRIFETTVSPVASPQSTAPR